MTPDFKYIEAGKTQDFAHMVAAMRMGLGGTKTLTRAESKLLMLGTYVKQGEKVKDVASEVAGINHEDGRQAGPGDGERL